MINRICKSIIIIIISFLVTINIFAQKNDRKNKFKEQYYTKNRHFDKDKLLKVKDKITILNISNYCDSVFPNDFIFEFKNLEELNIFGKIESESYFPLTYYKYKKIRIDTLKLKKMSSIIKLGFHYFDMDKFPLELSTISSLRNLTIHYTTMDSIPKEIKEFNHLKDLDLMGNCIVYVDTSIKQLVNLEKLNLAHNKLNTIPFALLDAKNIQMISLIDTDGPTSMGFNLNNINYNNDLEIEKLKILLYHSKVGITVQNCKEGNYVKERIDKELSKKLGISHMEVYDCTTLDLLK